MSEPIPSDTPERLFRELKADEIEEWIRQRRPEDLTLEFKIAPRNFGHRDERKALAEAISGFANSSGGLIIWGVRASRGQDGIDAAETAEPLRDARRFLSNLIRYAGDAVSPTLPGVVHRVVDGDLFATTYVPESDRGPHMARHGHSRYFKRSGDSFYRMEHFDVADMFGRRRRPALRLQLQKEGFGETVLVSIENEGRGIAKAPYLALYLPPALGHSQHGFDGDGSFGLPRVGRARTPIIFAGESGTVIHPRQTLPITKLEAMVRSADGRPVAEGSLSVRYELAAEDLELFSGECVLDY